MEFASDANGRCRRRCASAVAVITDRDENKCAANAHELLTVDGYACAGYPDAGDLLCRNRGPGRLIGGLFEGEAADKCNFGAIDVDGKSCSHHLETHEWASGDLECERTVEAFEGFVDRNTQIVDLEFDRGDVQVDGVQDVGTEWILGGQATCNALRRYEQYAFVDDNLEEFLVATGDDQAQILDDQADDLGAAGCSLLFKPDLGCEQGLAGDFKNDIAVAIAVGVVLKSGDSWVVDAGQDNAQEWPGSKVDHDWVDARDLDRVTHGNVHVRELHGDLAVELEAVDVGVDLGTQLADHARYRCATRIREARRKNERTFTVIDGDVVGSAIAKSETDIACGNLHHTDRGASWGADGCGLREAEVARQCLASNAKSYALAEYFELERCRHVEILRCRDWVAADNLDDVEGFIDELASGVKADAERAAKVDVRNVQIDGGLELASGTCRQDQEVAGAFGNDHEVGCAIADS